MAPGRPLQGAADLLHQQAGPYGCELRLLRPDDQAAAERHSGDPAAADRFRGRVHRRRRPGPDARPHLARRDDDRRGLHRRGDPGRHGREGPDGSSRADRAGRRLRRRADGGLPHRRGVDRRRPAAGRHPPRRAVLADHRRALRQRVQEQGRAAAARRGHRVPAGPDRRAGHRRLQAGRRVGQDRAASRRQRPVLGARVQDRGRPAPGPAHLHPALLGQARGRLDRAERDQGPQGADRQDLPDAREQA